MAWIELPSQRKRNSKKWQDIDDPSHFALDVAVGSMHYLSGPDWIEINPAWQPDTGAWQYKMVDNSFQLHARDVLNAGDTIQWLDPASAQTVTLQPLALNWVDNVTESRQQITQPQAVTATVDGSTLYWANGYGAGRHFRYTADNDRLIKELIIDSATDLPAPTVANPYLEIEYILKKSAGIGEYVDGVLWDRTTKVTTANAIEFRLTSTGPAIWSFASPRAYDSNLKSEVHSVQGLLTLRRQGATRYVTVRFPKSWVDSATFPIFLDPTIDAATAASADDAYEKDGGVTINDTEIEYWYHAEYACEAGFRFASIGLLASDTITSAYIRLYARSWLDMVQTVRGQNADNAAQFTTTNYSISTRPWVATTVNWTATLTGGAYNNSPNLSAILQAITGRAGWVSGNAMVIDAIALDGNDTQISFYDRGASYKPLLHIEYTSGGAAAASLVARLPLLNKLPLIVR